MFKYNKSISFRSVALPRNKHGKDPEAMKEIESQFKYNLEDKIANR